MIEKRLSVRQTEELIERTIDKMDGNRESGKGRSFKIAIKDVRIFVNSVRKLVKTIKETGVKAKYKEIDRGEYLELMVQIPKK